MDDELLTHLSDSARAELARRSLLDFTTYTFPGYKVNWHHRLIANELESLASFETERLIITTPPRRGKSELASRRLPAWLLGRNPDTEIIAASYAQDLANNFSRDVQRIMRSAAYSDVFGEVLGNRQAYEEFSTAGEGVYKAAGVGGPITGRGANYLLIDDPHKNRREAESEAKRNEVWEWFQDDALTRLEYPSAALVMATRWHHDDLIGRILASPDADLWRVIHLPEILDVQPAPYDPREQGEPLWPGKYARPGHNEPPEVLVERAVREYERRYARNAYGTEALFQGRPTPRAGGLFQRNWFQRYNSTPRAMSDKCNEIAISVDATFKKSKRSDCVAMLVAGRTQTGLIVVLDEIFGKMDYPETKQNIIRLRNKWPTAKVIIEDKANGPALIADLCNTLPRVIAFEPGRDSKDSRAQVAADRFEAGQIVLPSPDHAPWIGAWEEDFAGYPGRPYDDRVDALSQLCIHWDGRHDARQHLLRIVSVN